MSKADADERRWKNHFQKRRERELLYIIYIILRTYAQF